MKQVIFENFDCYLIELEPKVHIFVGDLQRKCLEECQGSEISLCKYSTSCLLIDEIFNGCRDASKQWMFKIMQSRKEISLQLLCMPWACHTLESFLSSLSNVLDAEVSAFSVNRIHN